MAFASLSFIAPNRHFIRFQAAGEGLWTNHESGLPAAIVSI
jgi:hypothetical protein